MKRVLITTLGCKVNQYESASFRSGFTQAGHVIVSDKEEADIVVINTCAVTAKAGSQSRQVVRQAIRKNPEARILITGCYGEIGAKELAAIEELNGREYSIIGNSKKDSLVTTAINYDQELEEMLLGSIDEARQICRLPVRRFGERTRAYLRVQDGCESYCTYCIVPFTRGPSRSLPLDEVLEQAIAFANAGHKEIVLTGIHLGNYGRDLAENEDIYSLIDRLSNKLPQIRYRISSLEPTEINDHLLNLISKRENLTPHLHIPLQSGDDTILSRMNRKYTTAEFFEVVGKCRESLPNAAIGIDILAGFPGETEEQFSNTEKFLTSLDCTYLHVFPYSRRPGTAAADFAGEIPKQEKLRRVEILRQLGENKREMFYRRQLGKVLPVLVEGARGNDGLLKGFTDNYVPVAFAGADSFKNGIVRVRLQRLDDARVLAEMVDAHENRDNSHRR